MAMLTVALLSSTNRVIMQTDPSAHYGPIGPFQYVASDQCRSRAAVAELTSGLRAFLLHTPRLELAADGIRDRRK